jgi:hypothetical protein
VYGLNKSEEYYNHEPKAVVDQRYDYNSVRILKGESSGQAKEEPKQDYEPCSANAMRLLYSEVCHPALRRLDPFASGSQSPCRSGSRTG